MIPIDRMRAQGFGTRAPQQAPTGRPTPPPAIARDAWLPSSASAEKQVHAHPHAPSRPSR